jgi:hypothetical protein
MAGTTRLRRYGAQGTLGAINLIVVIESLRADDKKTGRLLREDLEPVAIPYGNNLQIEFKIARSADELDFLLVELAEYVRLSGRAPCLHLECHGGLDGLELADGSTMPWTRLKALLVPINLASRMNLFLVLACCFGGYFAAECRFEETVPFAWILGPGKKIYPEPLLALTSNFYAELLKTRDLTQALTIAGAASSGISYFSMSAVGVLRTGLAARIRRAGSAASSREYRALEERWFAPVRQRFFALDRCPENEERFAITYAEVLAAALDGRDDGDSDASSN